MMIIFVVINRSISIMRHFKCNPTYEMIDLNTNDEEILHEDEQVIQENLTDDVAVNVTCHEVQGQQKVECLDTSFTAATQTRQSEGVYSANLKHDNAIYPKVTNQSPRLTGTRKGKLNVETSPGGLDLNQTLVSDEHKGHILSSGGKLEKRNQEQEAKQVNKNKQSYKKPPIIILLLCILVHTPMTNTHHKLTKNQIVACEKMMSNSIKSVLSEEDYQEETTIKEASNLILHQANQLTNLTTMLNAELQEQINEVL